MSQFCVYLHLYCTSSHPTSTPHPAFYSAKPRRAHTYTHTAMDPPCTSMFGAQRREDVYVVQFAHALQTAISTSAITPTKTAAFSTYQIRLSTLEYTWGGVWGMHYKIRLSTLEYACTKASSMLVVKLCSRSVASSTLAAKARVLSQRSLQSTRTLNRNRSFAATIVGASLRPLSKLCWDHCRSFDRFELVKASIRSQVFFFPAVKTGQRS